MSRKLSDRQRRAMFAKISQGGVVSRVSNKKVKGFLDFDDLKKGEVVVGLNSFEGVNSGFVGTKRSVVGIGSESDADLEVIEIETVPEVDFKKIKKRKSEGVLDPLKPRKAFVVKDNLRTEKASDKRILRFINKEGKRTGKLLKKVRRKR